MKKKDSEARQVAQLLAYINWLCRAPGQEAEPPPRWDGPERKTGAAEAAAPFRS